MELDHVVLENACHLCGVEWMAKRNEVGKLGQAIDDDHDRVATFRLGQPLR